MTNITKRSEKQEEFSSQKIEKSVRSAGADEKTAREIAEGVKHTDGLKTSDVRKHVAEKLTHHNEKLGKAYEGFSKPAPVKK